MDPSKISEFNIVMFPWFAAGHITPFLHLANKLAGKSFKITLILPKKSVTKFENLNLYPDLITLYPLTVPSVEGLPAGAETTADIHISLVGALATAMDRTRDQVEGVIHATKPKLVMYDSAHWVPEITRQLGIKTIFYSLVSAACIAMLQVPAGNISKDKPVTEDEVAVLPSGFLSQPFGEGITFYERVTTAAKNSDAIAIRTCWEIEGEFCNNIGSHYGKSVILTGPVLSEQAKMQLEGRWAKWLAGFETGSVVFCAFGSECILEKEQFQELVLGFELTGLPFLVALKPPMGVSTIEEALPEGFEKRAKGRGVVWGGWVQQPMILAHPSVGCFVSHCGFNSMWESLLSDCQMVLVPQIGDQFLNARLLAEELKVAVEVERKENGWFSKESLSKSILSVMEKDSEKGELLRENHKKWKDTLGSSGFMGGYIDKFVQSMHQLCK